MNTENTNTTTDTTKQENDHPALIKKIGIMFFFSHFLENIRNVLAEYKPQVVKRKAGIGFWSCFICSIKARMGLAGDV